MKPKQPRKSILDTLILLDAFARAELADYIGSDVQKRVSRDIEQGLRRRARNGVFVIPRNQLPFPQWSKE